MRGLMRSPWLSSLGGLLAVMVVFGGSARADVTSDRPGSIVVFPDVISDGTRNTIIEITNTSNMPVSAHCFYINASPSVPGVCSTTVSDSCTIDANCPSGETCVHCNETDFDIFLTAQQPTIWGVSTGRNIDPLDDQPGLDPGNIPARGTSFTGELKCVVTDSSGAPLVQNVLKGEATVTGPLGLVSEYNALAILGTTTPSGNDLNLGTNYNACPADLVMDHRADGSEDDFTGGTSLTTLSLVPCTEDLEDQLPTRGIVNFTIVNEFEQPLSVDGVNFDCLLNEPLSSISTVFERGSVGSDFAKTRITPSSSKICYSGTNRNQTCSTDSDCPGFVTSPSGTKLGCRAVTGVIGVAEEVQTVDSELSGSASSNLHVEGTHAGDVIVIPANP